MDSLDGNVEESGSRRLSGERVGLDIGAPHKFRRIKRYSMVPKVDLIFGDEIGSCDGAGLGVAAEVREVGDPC